MNGRAAIARGLDAVAWTALACVLLGVLVAAGQPLFTDDLWWHLGLGDAYAVHGPWLPRDPLLFTATGPPAPASWLADLLLAGVVEGFGLNGLRVFHVALVVAILGLAWRALRRTGVTAFAATGATAVFAAMAAYRLVQLRPHLATIALALALTLLVLQRREALRPGRVAGVLVLLVAWANLHAGFLLGPALIGLAALAVSAGSVVLPASRRPAAHHDALGLALLAVVGLALGGLNPQGFAQHLAFLGQGAETPSLGLVLDEWAGLAPLTVPSRALPPSPLTWLLFWALGVGSALAAVVELRRHARGEDASGRAPARVALAFASLAAMLFAVRFAWLAVFPLLLIASAAAPWSAAARRVRPLAWTGCVLLLPAFVVAGAWPMLSRGLPLDASLPARYAAAYPPGKYYANAVWFLSDAELRGNLYNEYVLGGFLGYWLAPSLRSFVNGTLNVPAEVMEDARRIRQGGGSGPGESVTAILDRYGVDLFLGIGVPRFPRGARPVQYSTTLLEDAPGWRLVFRDGRSAVHLRLGPGSAGKLEQIAAYYAREGVPFDPARGFEPERVLQAAPSWAEARGLVPLGFEAWLEAAAGADPQPRAVAREQLARAYALLGLYERSLALDRETVRDVPSDPGARRRMVWSLLRLSRADEALAALEAGPTLGVDDLYRKAALALRDAPDDPRVRALVGRLPVLSAGEAASLARATAQPELRLERRRSPD